MENITKRVVQAFPLPEWIDKAKIDCGCGQDCGPGASCGPLESIEEVLSEFSQKLSDKVEVRIAGYDTDTAISESINALNKVMEVSEEKIRINRENFELFMGNFAPLVAIDNRLAFIQDVPSNEQLVRALELIPAAVN